MGYCVNSSGALVPFASDKAACDAVGGSFTAEIKPTFEQPRNTQKEPAAWNDLKGQYQEFKNFLPQYNAKTGFIGDMLNPRTYMSSEQGGYLNTEGLKDVPYVGAVAEALNPAPEIASLINNLSDTDVRDAVTKAMHDNPIKTSVAGVTSLITLLSKKKVALLKLGYTGEVVRDMLTTDDESIKDLVGKGKEEISRGIFNMDRNVDASKNPEETKDTTETTKAEQDKKDREAADQLVKDKEAANSTTANPSFSERFKKGMKDPDTINKVGMLMDYYGRNLQDRGENPLVAYEAAKAKQAAANKPDTAAFNAVDMDNSVLTDLFTPNKGWFFGKSEEERKKLAAAKIGRYRTIQNAAFTRHGVILTHGEIMKLLEKERDEALAAAKRAKAAK